MKPDTYSLSSAQAQALLEDIATWGKTTTIILHGGCVFEFKGDFPGGSIAQGYYNLSSGGNGFEGHIKLEQLALLHFQQGTHRGRESYALCFQDSPDSTVFKVFLGRDDEGELIASQVEKFKALLASHQAN